TSARMMLPSVSSISRAVSPAAGRGEQTVARMNSILKNRISAPLYYLFGSTRNFLSGRVGTSATNRCPFRANCLAGGEPRTHRVKLWSHQGGISPEKQQDSTDHESPEVAAGVIKDGSDHHRSYRTPQASRYGSQ